MLPRLFADATFANAVSAVVAGIQTRQAPLLITTHSPTAECDSPSPLRCFVGCPKKRPKQESKPKPFCP
eukprot:9079262-Pyramimonas_sp.AAC.1